MNENQIPVDNTTAIVTPVETATPNRAPEKKKDRWQDLAELMASGSSVQVTVTGVATNREGRTVGLNATLMGLRAFLPGSQVPRGAKFEELTGSTIEVKVIECDRSARGGKLVVSRTRHLESEAAGFVATLQIDSEITGTVVSVVPNLGYFVNIGKMDALLHVTQTPLENGSPKTFEVGDTVTARIASVNPETNKVGLTMRQPRREGNGYRPQQGNRNQGNRGERSTGQDSRPNGGQRRERSTERPRAAAKVVFASTPKRAPSKPKALRSSRKSPFTHQFDSFAALGEFFAKRNGESSEGGDASAQSAS